MPSDRLDEVYSLGKVPEPELGPEALAAPADTPESIDA